MPHCMTRTLREPLLHRWDDVRYFLEALRAKSFTRAAQRLGTEQSTVSRRIAALEADLGVQLFERTRRAPVPTEAADRLREAAERIELELARFADDAAGVRDQKVEGRVRLATTEEIAVHFVLPRVIAPLRAEYPDLVIDVVTGYFAADLAAREADVALRFFQTPRGDLVGRRVGRFATAVLRTRAYAKAKRAKDVRDLDWVAVEPGMATPESAWLEAHVDRDRVMICSSYQVQLAAIRAGLGVGIGPRALTRIERDFVAVELPGAPLPVLDLHVVTRRAIRSLPRVAIVVDRLSQCFAGLGDA